MKRIIILLALTMLILPVLARAEKFRSGQRVEIKRSDEEGNTYAAGSVIDSETTIRGDFVAAGNAIAIRGPVTQSALVAGANIELEAPINQNARLVGGDVLINNYIGQDATVLAGNLEVGNQSIIADELIAMAKSVSLAGKIGKANITAKELTINGEILDSITVKAEKITINPGAIIRGNITYASPNNLTMSPEAKVGGKIEHKDVKKNGILKFATSAKVINFLSLLLLALALLYLWPSLAKAVTQNPYSSLRSLFTRLGLGLLVIILVPIITVALALTLVGFRLAVAGLLFFILTLIISSAYAIIILGSGVIKLFSPREIRLNWLIAIIGLLVGTILSLTPILGPFLLALFYLVALGSLWTQIFARTRRGWREAETLS